MKFSDIPADPVIKQKLIQTIQDQRVSHAQLFYGPEGSGKLALAIAYAQLINCQRPPNPLKGAYSASQENPPKGGSKSPSGDLGVNGDLGADSCGICPSCVQYQKLAHPDLHFFFPVATSKKVTSKPSSKHYITEWREFLLNHNYQVSLPEWYDFIGIENKQGTIYTDDAAEINRILGYKSYESEYKVVIIWMIEKLTYAAAPKMLKILEEPPEKTLFLLISDNPDHVISTILSRCFPVRIPRIPAAEMMKYMEGKEKSVGEEDQVNFETFRNWMRLCFSGNVPEMIAFANETAKIGREKQKSLLNFGLRVASEGTLLNHGIAASLKREAEEANFISRFSPYLTQERIPAFYERFNSAIFHVERNAHAPTLFLDLSLKISTLFKG
ncbi:MAG: hypothetical protein IH596_12490 [Bacteroidales bacterium]|nr:hypothetical protein [Bacteroidales bacterium]